MFSGKTSLNIIYPNMSMILPQLGPHLISSSVPNVIPTIMDVGGTKLERMRWHLSSFIFLLLSVSIIMRGWDWTFHLPKVSEKQGRWPQVRVLFDGNRRGRRRWQQNPTRAWHRFQQCEGSEEKHLIVGHFNTFMCMTSICFSRRTLTKVRAIT